MAFAENRAEKALSDSLPFPPRRSVISSKRRFYRGSAEDLPAERRLKYEASGRNRRSFFNQLPQESTNKSDGTRFPAGLLVDGFVLLYFATIIAIGLYKGRGSKDLESFAVGNRNIPWWAVLASILAAEISAATFLGAPGEGA